MIRYLLSEALIGAAGVFAVALIAWELYRHRDEIRAALRGDPRW